VATLYTIGHSTRSLDELESDLKGHGIETLVDIRAFPMSRRLPHFNRESLERSLPEQGIRYIWIKALGGYRKATRKDSPHTALRNASFRNYADYTLRQNSSTPRPNCLTSQTSLAPRICVPSAFTSAAIA
jgi:uncharacterized protein (DUF488 family)